MTRLSRLLIAAALSLAIFVALPPPADAAVVVMCRPAASGASAGPARWVAPASGTAYSLDGMGCAIVALADVPDAQAGGFTQSGTLRAFVAATGVLTSTTGVQVATMPASTYIVAIAVSNTTANAVTGGIDIGTTSSGADVVAALTCAASCLTFVADSALLKKVFSKTVPQAIWALGHTDGNSANLQITILYSYF